mgnify:CR=1 FL=1
MRAISLWTLSENGADDLRKDSSKVDDFVDASDKASEILNKLDGVI